MIVSPATNFARPLVRPAANTAPASNAKPAQNAAPIAAPIAVKAPAQGAIATTHNVLTAAAGAIGMGGFGAAAGWCAWFFTQGAMSSNLIGVGFLAGAAAGAAIGWYAGQERGKALENFFSNK